MHRIVKSPNLKTEPKIEGINNKIKTIKRQAYGYRDQEFFELKYYQCMTPSTDLSDKPD